MSKQPQIWKQPLGDNADKNDILDENLEAGFVDQKTLFRSIFEVPLKAGGMAPKRRDFNGLFNLIGQSIFYAMNGGVWEYNTSVDYDLGSFIKYNNELYLCIKKNGPSASIIKAPTDSSYWCKFATVQDLTRYLPLTGGNITGNLTVQSKHVVRSVNNFNADSKGNISITKVNASNNSDHATEADHATLADRAYPKRSDGTNINVIWSGQANQPSWLLGSNNGVDFYVWDPYNFSVNYAKSSGSAEKAKQNADGLNLDNTIVKNIAISGKTITVTKLDNTKYTLTTQDTNTTYSKLSQFQNDCGYITSNNRAYPREVGGGDINFNWSGRDGQPTWLWGGNDGTNMYVYNPANFSVNYANSSWLSTRAVQDSDGLQINTTYLKKADAGKVTLRATRNCDGNWSITGLTVGKPLYITHSGGHSCYIQVLSGTNDFVGHAYSIGAVYYYLVVQSSSGAYIYIPTSSTVTFNITNASDDGDVLRAYQ